MYPVRKHCFYNFNAWELQFPKSCSCTHIAIWANCSLQTLFLSHLRPDTGRKIAIFISKALAFMCNNSLPFDRNDLIQIKKRSNFIIFLSGCHGIIPKWPPNSNISNHISFVSTHDKLILFFPTDYNAQSLKSYRDIFQYSSQSISYEFISTQKSKN